MNLQALSYQISLLINYSKQYLSIILIFFLQLISIQYLKTQSKPETNMTKTINHSHNSAFSFCEEFRTYSILDLSYLYLPLKIDAQPISNQFSLKFNQPSPNFFNSLSEIQLQGKEQDSSNDSEQKPHSKDHSHSTISQAVDTLVKKRKSKLETKRQINQKNKDQGRGGNCIASNITKTLIRVIQSRFDRNLTRKFRSLIEKYNIKSQKENTIIMLLILYDFVKSSQISNQNFNEIFNNFMKSLIESKNNCEKKINDEPERKGFHVKNRKMYLNFIKINAELFDQLQKALRQQSSVKLYLNSISDIISDTYDRKQRQIEKAINKLKSIIQNYDSLKKLFGHEEDDIQSTFFEAIDYAYRRNLQKRCKNAKKKITGFFDKVSQNQPIQKDEQKFFKCFLGVQLIEEKQAEIWEQFIKSSNLKRQFNLQKQERERLINYLENKIPLNYKNFQRYIQERLFDENEARIQSEESSLVRMQSMFRIYLKFKGSIDF